MRQKESIETTSGDHVRDARLSVRTKRRLLAGVTIFVLMLTAAFILHNGTPSQFGRDPTLVRAGRGQSLPNPNSQMPMIMSRQSLAVPVLGKIVTAYEEWRGTDRSFDFPACVAAKHKISDLLDQYVQVTRLQCFVDREVAKGTISFGYTNNLEGPRWCSALEQTLQTQACQWTDPGANKQRNEALVLLQSGRIILVLPNDKAQQFRTIYPRLKTPSSAAPH